MAKFIVFKSVEEMPEMAVSRSPMSWNKTGSWRSATPRFQNKKPPCNHNCPAGEDIRGYLELIKKNEVATAFTLLTQTNPFPAVCGRVCYHPCQAYCNRHSFDTAIEVRLVEKFIGDWAVDNQKTVSPPSVTEKKIAVIGAGPAGMAAAYYLRSAGFGVTIYDENALPGGILQYGIPDYRLEKDVLQLELKRVLTGIDYRAKMKFGADFDVGELIDYAAVFLATGAHTSKKMNIAGEALAGVQPGLDYLKRVNSGEKNKLQSRQVLVVGGGNTACDVARTACSQGAAVTLAYRRTENEMPAFAEEIKQLKAEPIKLEFLVTPQRIRRNEQGQLEVSLTRMKLGLPDASGRPRPEPIAGADFELVTDVVFSAIGEETDLSFFPETQQITDGSFDFSGIDQRLKTKLFVGGDLLPQPRTVPHAVASGRLAAEKIAAFVEGREFPATQQVEEVAGPEDVNYVYFTRVNELKWQTAHVKDGRLIDTTAAMEEAGRCFSCGVCDKCDNCYNFCPDLAVIKTSQGYQVNLEYCKGCGICARECPRGSLHLEG